MNLRFGRHSGIHVFMALYGLSVFLETPPHLRKGRKRYIITSFALTILSGLAASLDMASDFQILFEAHSPSDWIALHAKYGDSWERRLNVAAMGLLLLIADGLLVRIPVFLQTQSLTVCNRFIVATWYGSSIGGWQSCLG